MIKVIEKTFTILNLVSSRGKASLAEIAAETGENKTTAANILRSLLDLGQLAKDDANNYSTGPAMEQLGMAWYKKHSLGGIAREVVQELAEQIRETAMVSVLDGGKRFTIAEVNARQGLVVNSSFFSTGRVYRSASGRVLVAMMTDDEQERYCRQYGLPAGDEWLEASTRAGLKKETARIRQTGMVEMVACEGEVQALAVPVALPDNKGWVALGTYLPVHRYKGTHKTAVIKSLKNAGVQMGRLLSSIL